jgi:hypothetical protein
MAAGDLTTLANVQAWLGDSASGDAALLARLVTAASRFVLSDLQRPSLASTAYSETYDGSGGRVLVLRQWPVTAVTALTIDGTAIPAAGTPASPGYVLEPWDGVGPGRPQRLTLFGYRFPAALAAVGVSYAAGYLVPGETHQIPASAPFAVTTALPFLADGGVSYAGGGALVPVPASPAHGQYTIGLIAGVPTYGFAAADAGLALSIAYSFVPPDVEQAVIELVGERYRYLQRIGQVSHGLGGQETVAFSQKSMHDFVAALLQPFRRTVPL